MASPSSSPPIALDLVGWGPKKLAKLKIRDLREECSRRGLEDNGGSSELINRLLAWKKAKGKKQPPYDLQYWGKERLKKLTLPMLREECEKRNLDKQGDLSTLVHRLLVWKKLDSEQASAALHSNTGVVVNWVPRSSILADDLRLFDLPSEDSIFRARSNVDIYSTLSKDDMRREAIKTDRDHIVECQLAAFAIDDAIPTSQPKHDFVAGVSAALHDDSLDNFNVTTQAINRSKQRVMSTFISKLPTKGWRDGASPGILSLFQQNSDYKCYKYANNIVKALEIALPSVIQSVQHQRRGSNHISTKGFTDIATSLEFVLERMNLNLGNRQLRPGN